MKYRRPLRDGWVCPHCGQTLHRHGRGGSRACKAEQSGPTCPGVVCECEDGICYSKQLGYGWRRSPCPNAHCLHCGWRGTVRSREFEREYGSSRCTKSATGWHYAKAGVEKNLDPSSLRVVLKCQICGSTATKLIDPIDDLNWKPVERALPPPASSGHQEGNPGGDKPDDGSVGT